MVDYEARNKEIVQRLQETGWAISYECQDAGGLKTPSVWKVVITRQGKKAVTKYTKGAAHRHWKKKKPWQILPSLGTFSGYWDKYFKPGKPVQQILPDLKDPKDCELREHQQQVFDEYAALTEPNPPTLDEVMYNLSTDVSSVRYGQTFDDFCHEFGYSNDSIEAKGIYDGCIQEWQNLLRLGADLDALQELFQDY